MKIMSGEYAENLSFKEYRLASGINYTAKQKSLIQNISRELNVINPDDRRRRSYMRMADSNGYDVYFSPGRQKDSINVDIVNSKKLSKKGSSPQVSSDTFVGTYSANNKFKIDDFVACYDRFDKKSKFVEKSLYIIFGCFIASLAMLPSIIDGSCSRIARNVKEYVANNDSVKLSEHLSQDTIKFLPVKK